MPNKTAEAAPSAAIQTEKEGEGAAAETAAATTAEAVAAKEAAVAAKEAEAAKAALQTTATVAEAAEAALPTIEKATVQKEADEAATSKPKGNDSTPSTLTKVKNHAATTTGDVKAAKPRIALRITKNALMSTLMTRAFASRITGPRTTTHVDDTSSSKPPLASTSCGRPSQSSTTPHPHSHRPTSRPRHLHPRHHHRWRTLLPRSIPSSITTLQNKLSR